MADPVCPWPQGLSNRLVSRTPSTSARGRNGHLAPMPSPRHPPAVAPRFPSLKARVLIAVLCRQPLGYRVVRQVGSHRRLEAPDRPPLTLAFHERATIAPGLVRKILVDDVGLSEDEARGLLWAGGAHSGHLPLRARGLVGRVARHRGLVGGGRNLRRGPG